MANYLGLRRCGSKILYAMRLSKKLGKRVFVNRVEFSLRTSWKVVELGLYLGKIRIWPCWEKNFRDTKKTTKLGID